MSLPVAQTVFTFFIDMMLSQRKALFY